MKKTFTIEDYIAGNFDVKPVARIPDGITKIGREAFAGDENVEVVILPDSVEVIGRNAFEDCINLVSVVVSLRSRLRKIGKNAFVNTSLVSMSVPIFAEAANSAFNYCGEFKGLIRFLPDYGCEDFEEDEEPEISETSGCGASIGKAE